MGGYIRAKLDALRLIIMHVIEQLFYWMNNSHFGTSRRNIYYFILDRKEEIFDSKFRELNKGVVLEIAKRKEWEKKTRQDRIIDIAENLFNENGYEATTLDVIAKFAGYSKRSLYQYFSDKNDLFSAVTLKALKELNARLMVVSEIKDRGIKKTVYFIEEIFKFFLEYRRPFENIIFFDVSYCFNHESSYNEEGAELSFSTKAKKLHDINMQLLLHIIEEGISDKTITSSFTSKQLLLILWGQVLGFVHSIAKRYEGLQSEFNTSAEEMFANYLKLVTNCLAGKEY